MSKLLAIILVLVVSGANCSEWNYQADGPDAWPHEFSDCAGIQQSPINIDTSKVIANNNLKSFVFNNYTQGINLNFTNNGHTVVASQIFDAQSTPDIPFITGSDFTEPYYFSQFHFHWGYNIYQGSEHYINEDKFPLELHLVHKSNAGKLAVLGFLFQINDKADTTLLDPLFTMMAKETKINTWQKGVFKLNTIIPSSDTLSSDGYYRYAGSLTTPPCTEGVIWTVFRTKINITNAQLVADFLVNDIKFNDRSTQKLNARTVYGTPGIAGTQSNRGDKLAVSCYNWSLFYISLIFISSFLFKL